MKKVMKYSYFLIGLMIFSLIPLEAVVLKDEDIDLQAIWESPKTSKWRKFRIFLHDLTVRFPFSDAKNPRQEWLNFEPKCNQLQASLQERTICRLAYNQMWWAYGFLIGVPLVVTFLNVLVMLRNTAKTPPVILNVPPLFMEISGDLQIKMGLPQGKNTFDVFTVLGLTLNASAMDIESKYRKLALKYHPDKHPGEKEIYEAIFKIIGAAKDAAIYVINHNLQHELQRQIADSSLKKLSKQPAISVMRFK